MTASLAGGISSVFVIIPARDAADTIGHLVRTVRGQRPPGLAYEVIVVDDRDGTREAAEREGARVVRRDRRPEGGNPAAARNRGAVNAEPGVRLVRRAVGRDLLPTNVLLAMWASCWRGLWGFGAARREAARRREQAG